MTLPGLWTPAEFNESLYRASELFTWLAMEGTEPFLPRFGLGQVDAGHLRDVAREYLAMYDGLDLRAEVAPPPVQFERALGTIERLDGHQARIIIATWHAIGVPDGSDYSRAMRVWFHHLHDIAFDHHVSLEASLLAEVRPILSARLSSDMWLRAIDGAKRPSDPWEIAFYRKWNETVGHGTSPTDGLRDALNFNDLHDAWSELQAALSVRRLNAIRKWVKRRAWKELSFGALPPPARDGWADWQDLRRQGMDGSRDQT